MHELTSGNERRLAGSSGFSCSAQLRPEKAVVKASKVILNVVFMSGPRDVTIAADRKSAYWTEMRKKPVQREDPRANRLSARA